MYYSTNLIFKKVCPACPELYDVISPDGEVIGYVRYRHGYLTAGYYSPEFLNGDSEFVFYQRLGDEFDGLLFNEQREYYFPIIAEKLVAKYITSVVLCYT